MAFDSHLTADNTDARNDGSGEEAISTRTGVPLRLTVRAMLDRAAEGGEQTFRDRQEGLEFVRKILALLFLQYLGILVIVAPFCYVEFVKQFLSQNKIAFIFIGVGSFLGLGLSVYLAGYKGHIQRSAITALCLGTISFAVAVGSKLALVSWSIYALISISQATVNISVLHALVQLDDHFLVDRLRGSGVLWAGLVMALFWVPVMLEEGAGWPAATVVPAGGWLYFCSVVRSVRKTMCHREPWDYLRAVIFVLGPNVPDKWLFSRSQKRRTTVRGRWKGIKAGVLMQAENIGKDNPLVDKTGTYGGTDDGTNVDVL